jgi:hypothetical protein
VHDAAVVPERHVVALPPEADLKSTCSQWSNSIERTASLSGWLSSMMRRVNVRFT